MVGPVPSLRHACAVVLALGLGAPGCSAEHTAAVAPLVLSPPRGTQGGGQAVRIEGDDFVGHGPVSIYFGMQAAKAVVVHSPWLITVLTPQREESGTVPVWLRFGEGKLRRIRDAYTFDEQPGIVLRPRIGG